MAPRRELARPHKRDVYSCLVRWLREFALYHRRNPVMISTGIRIGHDPRAILATEAVRRLDVELEQYWTDKHAGRDPDAEARYARARETAQRLGFAYVSASEAASLPIGYILLRIESLEARKTIEAAPEIAAVLGGEPPPAIMLSAMVEEYE